MKTLFADGDFFEGARWHDGAWWASDIFGARVWRIAPDGSAEVMAEVEHWPSGLGWLPDGDMLIVSIRDRTLLRRDRTGRLSVHADLAPWSPYWLNDMLVDAEGRAYVGNLGADLPNGGNPGLTTICRIDPDGSGRIVATDLLFPNGMALSRDGRTLIVGESLANRMTAFTVADDGNLSDRRIWAQFATSPAPADWSMALLHHLAFSPDGCSVADRDGCLWVADASNGRACRVAEGGRILQEVRPPDDYQVFACALGGEDGRSLLLCAAPSVEPSEVMGKRRGALFVERVEVPVA
jgi:sugar lactone lactonase YvrE